MDKKTKIAVFASGTGSNALNLFQKLGGKADFYLYSNKITAGVIEKAKPFGIETLVFDKKDFYENGKVLADMKAKGIDCAVLAGFLWLVPEDILAAFPRKIINLHPSLLPKHGGKGMYGAKVHEAVLLAGDKESGITIHLADPRYDEGEYLLQAKCPVNAGDTPESLAAKIHALEHEFLPKEVQKLINDCLQLTDHQ